MKNLILCIARLLLSLSRKPQTSTASSDKKQWTLSECVQYALENNISIKQSQLEIESADANKLSAIGIFYLQQMHHQEFLKILV
jgi:outer membrane protein